LFIIEVLVEHVASFESLTLDSISNLLAVGITCIRLLGRIPALDVIFIDVFLDVV